MKQKIFAKIYAVNQVRFYLTKTRLLICILPLNERLNKYNNVWKKFDL